MSDNQGEFSKSCHFQMMVYILCVDRSSGVEERKERDSAMSGERETPKGISGNCSYVGFYFCCCLFVSLFLFFKHPDNN